MRDASLHATIMVREASIFGGSSCAVSEEPKICTGEASARPDLWNLLMRFEGFVTAVHVSRVIVAHRASSNSRMYCGIKNSARSVGSQKAAAPKLCQGAHRVLMAPAPSGLNSCPCWSFMGEYSRNSATVCNLSVR